METFSVLVGSLPSSGETDQGVKMEVVLVIQRNKVSLLRFGVGKSHSREFVPA